MRTSAAPEPVTRPLDPEIRRLLFEESERLGADQAIRKAGVAEPTYASGMLGRALRPLSRARLEDFVRRQKREASEEQSEASLDHTTLAEGTTTEGRRDEDARTARA